MSFNILVRKLYVDFIKNKHTRVHLCCNIQQIKTMTYNRMREVIKLMDLYHIETVPKVF